MSHAQSQKQAETLHWRSFRYESTALRVDELVLVNQRVQDLQESAAEFRREEMAYTKSLSTMSPNN